MNEKKLFDFSAASATVFVVDYQYKKPPRAVKVPGSAKKEDDVVQNRLIVMSGDPSGRDVYDIASRLVIGPVPYEGADFRLLTCQKMVDAMGLVQVTSWDKLEGKAPEKIGVDIQTEEESEEDGDEGGSVPPAANLN